MLSIKLFPSIYPVMSFKVLRSFPSILRDSISDHPDLKEFQFAYCLMRKNLRLMAPPCAPRRIFIFIF